MLAYTQKEVAKRHDSAKANNAVTLRRLCVKADFAVRRDMLWIERLTFLVEGLPQNCVMRQERLIILSTRGMENELGRISSDLNESSIWKLKSDVSTRKSLFRAFRTRRGRKKLDKNFVHREILLGIQKLHKLVDVKTANELWITIFCISMSDNVI